MKAPRPCFDVWSLCVDLSDCTGLRVRMHVLSLMRLKERKYIKNNLKYGFSSLCQMSYLDMVSIYICLFVAIGDERTYTAHAMMLVSLKIFLVSTICNSGQEK
jgi:hypothetical protein